MVVIHKKAMIRLEIDKVKVEYKAAEEEIGDRLILTKNHWGYIEIRVSTMLLLSGWSRSFCGQTALLEIPILFPISLIRRKCAPVIISVIF